MRAKGQTLSERTSRWETVTVHLAEEQNLAPHEAEQVAELQRLLLEARQIGVKQEAARAEFRALGTQIRKIARQGDQVRSRLGASLRSRLGFTADTLVRYGFSPVNLRRSKSGGEAKKKEPASS